MTLAACLRLAWPILPGALLGPILLVTKPGLWEAPEDPGGVKVGIALAAVLLVSLAGWFLAPILGERLAVVSSSYSTAGLGESTSGQRTFGAALVRCAAWFALHLMLVVAWKA